MAYYVISTAPRQEEAFLKVGSRLVEVEGISLVFPRRTMDHMKGGVRVRTEVALFPGYVFLRADGGLDAELYARVKALPGYQNFLRRGSLISEVRGRDLEILSHFLKFGEVAPVSQVYFDENQRIRVVSGPMEGMEGQIVHVDRRKRRAKIRLDFHEGTFTISLGFELLTQAVGTP